MPIVLFFATAADAARTRSFTSASSTVDATLHEARETFGPELGRVLDGSRFWLNGDAVDPGSEIACRPEDELAVIPPVSGG